MNQSTVAITNLLYRYAELMDQGKLEAVAALFQHARIKMRGSEPLLDSAQLLDVWRSHVVLYPCGTPRTQHVVTNPIIELDDVAGRAAVRSCYSVYQATEGFPLQLIAAGRYHDEFERHEEVWRFSYRDYSMLDLVGDLRFHLREAIAN